MIGTLVNAAAVLLGGGLGLLFKGRIPEKISQNTIRAIGLCVCIIGISGAIKGNLMLVVGSLALGAFSGELLNIEGGLDKLGSWLQKKMSRGNSDAPFAEGFTTATLLFCVGTMSIIGSINGGLKHEYSIIFTKSILDGISAMVLASTFGFGVLFSIVVIIAYQGSIELFAGYLQNVFTDGLVTQITAVGSVMILGLGLNMALNAKFKAANLLPGLIFAAGFYYLFMSQR